MKKGIHAEANWQSESKTRTETMPIKGMHCQSCVKLIETSIGSLDGIENIKVNLAEDNAVISFDPDKIGLDKIKSEIGALGFTVEEGGSKDSPASSCEDPLIEETAQQETISVKGMTCHSCVKLIESRVGSLEGVENLQVNLAEDNTVVKFDPGKTDLDKIKSEIRAMGFKTGDGIDKTSSSEPTSEVVEASQIACAVENKNNIWKGIAYGLVPHIGCIGFIVASILGATVAMSIFRPLLMNRYIFHILILISILFATVSSLVYLRKNGLLSLVGVKKKKGYLATMYGSTVGINLILFILIFPLLANVSLAASPTGALVGVSTQNLDTITLEVDIPCPGHAPLISNELQTIDGVLEIKFSFPDNFGVTFDTTKTSEQEMLSLEVFDEYPVVSIDKSAVDTTIARTSTPRASADGSCCGGGGSGSCGGSCGGGCGG